MVATPGVFLEDRCYLRPQRVLMDVFEECQQVGVSITQNSFVAALEKMADGYCIETANSANAALAKIRQGAFALVVTDYMMPDMNGLELAQAVRQIAPETQVVLMTGYSTAGLSEIAGELELGGYIEKPFTVDQIHAVVAQAIECTKAAKPTPQTDASLMLSLNERLDKLLSNTDSLCALLLSSGGYPLAVVGVTNGLNIHDVGALIAANFTASEALAKLLGSDSVFKSSYNEGPEYNIFAYEVNSDLLLAVIFDPVIKPGTVWHYAKKAAVEIEELVISQPAGVELDRDMLEGITSEIEQMFVGEDDGAPEEAALMSFEDAIEAGLIPSGIDVADADLQKSPKESAKH